MTRVAAARHRHFNHDRLTVIEPRRHWQILDWRELWAYRELLGVLTLRDVKVRYKQTVLGVGWAILRPLTTMVIFTVVFGRMARLPSDGYPYTAFVYAALLPWTFFAAAVSASAQSLIGSGHLVSKVYFPRILIALSSIGACLVDLLVSCALFVPLMLWYQIGWSWNMVAAPLLIASVVVAALAVGTFLSALTVSYRDFTHITPFIVQIWMYVTPVVFSASMVPDRWQWLLYVNPMTAIVEGFRSVLLGSPFDIKSLMVSIAVSLLMLCAGLAYFDHVERRFADVI